jgi:hypothetical protein
MGLLDQLNASGAPPAQQFRASQFFKEHPNLPAEIEACRAAGFSWRQIADQINADYNIRLGPTSIADWMHRQP